MSPGFRQLLLSFILLSFSSAYSQVQTPRYISTCTDSHGFYEYLPKGYSATGSKKYPLLIFSHGTGENGDGSPVQLPRVLVHGTPQQISQGVFPDSFVVNGQIFRYIVISPQYTRIPFASDMQQIINYAVANYDVDTNRIYLTGLSQGGGLVWEYSGQNISYGKRIAAIVPVAGSATPSTLRAQNIAAANIAVWATHNNADPTVPVSNTINFVKMINAAPTKPTPLAKKTIFQSNTHDAWTMTYDLNFKENNLNVYEWMLQYSRANGTLAVYGLNFSVTKKDNETVLLSWQTSSENNNKGFAIERSKDGNSFDSIAFVSSLSINGRGANYGFINVPVNNGITYYRLRQINFDNSYTYSPVRFVKFDNNGIINIYPNPATEQIHIKTATTFTNAQMKIYNTAGKLVMQKIINGSGVINVSLNGLATGIYIAKIFTDDKQFEYRFVKK